MLVLIGVDDLLWGLIADDDFAHDDKSEYDDDELEDPEAALIAQKIFLGFGDLVLVFLHGHENGVRIIVTFIIQNYSYLLYHIIENYQYWAFKDYFG